jgi:N-methylhydantoinase A
MNVMLDALDETALVEMIEMITAASTKTVRQSNAKLVSIDRIIELDMLYLGQTHSVSVPLAGNPTALTIDVIRTAFEATYLKTYSRLLADIPVRILNLRLSVIGARPAIDLGILAGGERADTVAECAVAAQPIFANAAWHDTMIYDRLRLPEGSAVAGPALLVQADATIYVDPGLIATVDNLGNVIIKVNEG